jgi:hypothetical protein
VAPDGTPQSDLFLQKLNDVLRNEASAKDLAESSGIPRERIEQFARKYTKIQSAPAGPGRDIKIKPGEQTTAQPSPNLPALDANRRFSSKNQRNKGTMAQDQVHGNYEGVRFVPPPEWRGQFEDYKISLSKVLAPKRTAKPTPKNTP